LGFQKPPHWLSEPMAQSLRKKAEQLGFGAAIGAQE